MNRIFHSITNFTAGELSPWLDARVDLAKYANGVKTLINFIVHPHGGVSRRPGTKYVYTAKYAGYHTRLIPFEFSVDQAYILEFGDGYIRFYMDQGRIADTTKIVNGTFDSDIDNWDDISTPPNAAAWNSTDQALDLIVTAAGSAWAEQAVANMATQTARTLAYDLNTATPITIYVGSTSGAADILSTAAATGSDQSVTVPANNYGTNYIQFLSANAGTHTLDNIVLTGPIYEIWSPYSYLHINQMYYAQGANTMYLAHPNYPPYKLVRTDDDDWTLTQVEFGPVLDPPANATAVKYGVAQANERTYKYKVTSYARETGESLTVASNLACGEYDRETGKHFHVYWDPVDGAEKYFIYRWSFQDNSFGLFGWTEGGKTSFFDLSESQETDINMDEPPPEEVDPFSSVGNYPSVVSFFEQRSIWAGTNNDTNKFWVSRSGAPEDLTRGVVDDDGFSFRIAEDFNRIRWAANMRTFLFGTAGGEGRIQSDAIGEPITQENVFVRRETNYGADPVQPILAGNSVIYVQRLGRKIREFFYSTDLDSWSSEDLTLLSQQLLSSNTGTIVQLAYSKEPQGMILGIRSDGWLLAQTWNRPQDVFAWHRHNTQGYFKSCACIPGSDRTEIWSIVHRTIGGTDYQFVELHESQEFTALEDYWGLDCALQYSQATPVTTITGLEHLAGASVSALANGVVIADQTVSAGGTIALANAATLVTAGLGYTGWIQTMRPEFATKSGTSQAKMKKIIRAMVRVFRTAKFKIGATSHTSQDYPVDVQMDEVSFSLENDGRPYGDTGAPMSETNALWTCDKEVIPPGGWTKDGYLWIQAEDPLPVHILGIFARLSMGDM